MTGRLISKRLPAWTGFVQCFFTTDPQRLKIVLIRRILVKPEQYKLIKAFSFKPLTFVLSGCLSSTNEIPIQLLSYHFFYRGRTTKKQ